ncbi:hypothetical protein SAMN04487977_101536 [Treponema bryantii]|uniref:Uncharacterized protein n=1 Tax=Treponema bryantii TaxID=163 RepID=A0A1H9B0E6_9SPIR|nr:hypothetical protein [Treponema bryantii]SEP82502.1 hypothetical protein SAMN04487977_101536 [Treponema bryantii]
MTRMESLEESYETKSKEIAEEVKEGKKKLAELGFGETVKAEVFTKVFKEYWIYQINEIRLMSVDKREKSECYRMQFMIRFEDNSDFFIYLEAK